MPIPSYLAFVVDDSVTDIRYAEWCLERARRSRWTTESFRSLAELRERLEDEPAPDLILLDQHLPDGEGMELLRDGAGLELPPVLLVTGSEQEQTGYQAIEVGAEDYLTKGNFDPFRLELSALNAIRIAEQEQKLRARNAELDRYAALVAHELKNPLASAFTAVSSLELEFEKEEAEASEYVRELVTRAVAALERSSDIVDRLLEATRDEGRVHAEMEEVDLVALLHGAVGGENGAVRPRPELQVDADVCTATVDPDLFCQVVGNLVRNAVRHTPDDGEVRVRLDCDDTHVGITVLDTGPGVPWQVRERLFEPFSRGSQDGLGLGLWISRRFAEAMGGTLQLVSPPGPGAEFLLRLPRHPDHAVEGAG